MSPAAALIRPSATVALLAALGSLFREHKGGTPEVRFRDYGGGRGLSRGGVVGTEGGVFESVFDGGKKVLIFLGGPEVTRSRPARSFLPGDALSSGAKIA